MSLSSICRSVTYILWSSSFASYLEDHLMEKCYTWDNESVWLKDWPCKICMGQQPIFHVPLILPYITVIDLNYIYTLRNGAGRGGIRAPPGTCSSFFNKFHIYHPFRRSLRNQRKASHKKWKLKEGSQYEDCALIAAIAKIITYIDGLRGMKIKT